MSGKYIVVFKDSASQAQIDKYAQDVESNGGNVGHKYDSALRGFSAAIPDAFLQTLQAQGLADGIIDYIEPDGTVTIQ
ncbi:hypothetical protein QCA50_004255 [Cerrena zonata]|uniref:Inhibitor I9 domain-containing protein n=1 Tax=Cerrena zonata TaxID=2478898 RepID=A0AAW0GRL9_9APHY